MGTVAPATFRTVCVRNQSKLILFPDGLHFETFHRGIASISRRNRVFRQQPTERNHWPYCHANIDRVLVVLLSAAAKPFFPLELLKSPRRISLFVETFSTDGEIDIATVRRYIRFPPLELKRSSFYQLQLRRNV